MYNTKDLIVMLQELEATMNSLVDKVFVEYIPLTVFSPHNLGSPVYWLQEIQHAYHTNALLIKMLLAQAQANGVDLLVDTNALENEFLLKQIAVSEQTALSRPASDFIRRNTTLGKIGAVTTVTVSDPKALKVWTHSSHRSPKNSSGIAVEDFSPKLLLLSLPFPLFSLDGLGA